MNVTSEIFILIISKNVLILDRIDLKKNLDNAVDTIKKTHRHQPSINVERLINMFVIWLALFLFLSMKK